MPLSFLVLQSLFYFCVHLTFSVTFNQIKQIYLFTFVLVNCKLRYCLKFISVFSFHFTFASNVSSTLEHFIFFSFSSKKLLWDFWVPLTIMFSFSILFSTSVSFFILLSFPSYFSFISQLFFIFAFHASSLLRRMYGYHLSIGIRTSLFLQINARTTAWLQWYRKIYVSIIL